jgi:3-phenylpropionate/trans-cinnamate dioxygenase ferredoxin component
MMFDYTNVPPESCDFYGVVPLIDLPNGERMFLEIDGKPIVIFNIGGQFYAIDDTCTHDDGPLGDGELEGFEIVCPRHGAQFDVRTGQVTQMPAVADIAAYPVRVEDGVIMIGVPKE